MTLVRRCSFFKNNIKVYAKYAVLSQESGANCMSKAMYYCNR